MKKNYFKNKINNLLEIEKFKFYLFYILLGVLLIILSFQIFTDIQQDQKNYVSLTNDALDERMSSLYSEINSLPSGAGNDVLFLSNLVDVGDFVSSGLAENEGGELIKEFSEFLNQNIAYKKLTIIRLGSQDVLNVERQIDGKIVSNSIFNEQFINKDFLDEVIKLQKDKVYISDLQKDTIFNSDSLVLYYATPIFNDNEKMEGILILTVDPSYFLDDVRNFSRPGEQVFLINSLGNYLASYDVTKEYINNGDKFIFKKDFPEVADEILSLSDQRIIQTDKDVFVFRYIQPTLSKFDVYKISGNSNVKTQDNFYWVLVSVSDRQNINTVLASIMKQRFLLFLLTITIIFFIGLVVFSIQWGWGFINKIKNKELT